ncbi:heat shock cognate 70 kDa protein 2-like [Dendrobium catenatum]|uniref:Heat shock cognate 70 kDa protein 2 n=1 Tax=Dendrobium catenatum TaxID=906689 RepID=A0A2I0VP05_9ASPA|nr:heat shock cognate 70 kDa protein 2-like [Dendrobium catenatum]PKU65142.1 Heat shock cognate 70 kDa protein 2 [Dendrobium catenatum]
MDPPAQIPCSGNCLVHLHSFSGHAWLLRRICPFLQYPGPLGIPHFLITQTNNQAILLSHIEIITLHFLLKKATIEGLGLPARHIVAILPASSNTTHFQTQLSAGASGAAMRILFFMARPVLAASYYQSLTPGHRTVLVFELGVEIFEVSLLTEDENLKVKAAVSDLGCPLFNFMASELPRCIGIDITGDASGLLRIREACERAKNALCLGSGTADVMFERLGSKVSMQINREWLVWLNLNHLHRGIMRCLMEGGVRREAVHEIVLAGASTNIPEVRQVLRQCFRRQPFRCDIDPENIVELSAMQYVNDVSARYNIPLFGLRLFNFGLYSI